MLNLNLKVNLLKSSLLSPVITGVSLLSLNACAMNSQQADPLANSAMPPASTSQLLVNNQTASLAATTKISTIKIKNKSPNFDQIVSRLQDLGYLPLTHGFILAQNGKTIRHDAFLWPVPQTLQDAADSYAWNAKNPFIRGAIIQFERQNGILGPRGVSEGNLHPAVIHALFAHSARKNKYPWQWVYVVKQQHTNLPEKLYLWQHGGPDHGNYAFMHTNLNGHYRGQPIHAGYIWQTVVNTGVLGATPNGTWPIYQRLPSTTMRGVFPIPISNAQYQALAGKQVPQWGGSKLLQPARGIVNGHPVKWQPYNDPGILWVNYFDAGRGIHYYPRARYGFPQSAGCVEEPYASAPITYHLLHYGVPVTISGNVFHG